MKTGKILICQGLIVLSLASFLFGTGLRGQSIAAGNTYAGAVDPSGTLRTWGGNSNGQLGHSPGVNPVAMPDVVPGVWRSVAMSSNFTLAIDSSNVLWGWGNNTSGQLGTGTNISSNVPVRVALPAGSVVRAVAAGLVHGMALVDVNGGTGRIYVWGVNSSGQLGMGDTTGRNSPALLGLGKSWEGKTYRAIATSNQASFAIDTEGKLWAWGSNGNGELGQFKTTAVLVSSPQPLQIGGQTGWSGVSAGNYHVLALRGNELYAWGQNAYGQVGIGSTGAAQTGPVRISSGLSWSGIGAGDSHSFGITAAGVLYGWGNNQYGQLALPVTVGGSNFVSSPQLTGSEFSPWVEIAGGLNFTIAKTVTGTVYTVGANSSGQLGNGLVENGIDYTPAFSPPKIGGVNLSATAPSVPTTDVGINTILQPVSVVVQNTGQASLEGGFTLGIYLSSSPVLDVNAQLLVSRTVTESLAPLATRNITFASPGISIPDTLPGARYLISQVTPIGAIDSYSPDNGASTSITIAGPDLTLEELQLSNLIAVNTGTFDVTGLKLRNGGLGTLTGRTVVVEAYISSDNVLSLTTDEKLSEISYSGTLTSTASAQLIGGTPWTLPIPTGKAGGNYTLIFIVNRDANIVESGSLSNLVSVAVSISSADLAVTTPLLPDVAIPPGGGAKVLGINMGGIAVTTFVQNLGTVAYTNTYTVKLYLSSDGTFDAGDRPLGTPQTGSNLAANASALVRWTDVTIPDVIPGNYYLVARVTMFVGDVDRSPSNDTAATPVILAGATLFIENVNFPNGTTIETGGSFGPITYNLRNAGSGGVPVNTAIPLEVFISADNLFDRNSDPRLDAFTYTLGLTAGQAEPVGGRVINPPQNMPSGIYTLFIIANDSGSSPRVPSANTAIYSQTVVVGALDVEVLPLSFDGSGPVGSNPAVGVNSSLNSVTATLRNLGSFSVPSGISARIYLSTDDVYSTNDIQLAGALTVESPLAGNASRALSFGDIIVPDEIEGNYYLIVAVTLPGSLLDVNPANNQAATPINLRRPNFKVSNLTMDAVEIDLNVSNPQFTQVTFQLGNDSPGVVSSGTAIGYRLYLSNDLSLETSGTDLEIYVGSYSGTIPPNSASNPVSITPTFDIDIPDDIIGGTYYLFLVVNADGAIPESDALRATIYQEVRLNKANAPGAAMDFGAFSLSSGTKEWRSVQDSRASGANSYQSPALLALGESATMSLGVTGPTTVRAPWLILGGVGDTVSYALDGVTGANLSGYQPTYAPNPISVPDGEHTLTWTYQRGDPSTSAGYARVDLDVPNYLTSGDGFWFGTIGDGTAKIGSKYANSPVLESGQQSALEVSVIGPAVVSFWWRFTTDNTADTLSFFVDGVQMDLPTEDLDEIAQPARLQTTTDWEKVAFLIDSGPRVLRWVYTHSSPSTSTSFAALDGLEVLNPVPSSNVVNRITQPVTHSNVPVDNIDLAIVEVIAPTGTYLLDDAGGTSRLPVTITVRNIGAPFTSQPTWDTTDLELLLSLDDVYGNADDVILGTFAQLSAISSIDQVIFDAQVNLPFDLAAGNYRFMVRFQGAVDTGEDTREFTLANNTRVLSPGYIIQRAPDLKASSESELARSYPYHPEDAVYIQYSIRNTGLGTLLPTQPFKVQLELMGLTKEAFGQDIVNLGGSILIKSYPKSTYSLFLPEAQGQYPVGTSYLVTHFIDLPSLRDLLVALGLIPAGTPEDDINALPDGVAASQLDDWRFYFRVNVDVDQEIIESSETNQFNFVRSPDENGLVQWTTFFITPNDGVGNLGTYMGQPAFEETQTGEYVGATLGDPAFDALLAAYAFGEASEGTVNLLFDSESNSPNGQPSVLVPPGESEPYLALTFDFNVTANDFSLVMEGTDNLLDPWESIITLTPPYYGTSGPRSLSGFGGLKDNPRVLSLEGNSTQVQHIYKARITVRDLLPISQQSGSRYLRLRIVPAVSVPPATPTDLSVGYNAEEGEVEIYWTGTLDTILDPLGSGSKFVVGAFVVERSVTGRDFKPVGSVTSPLAQGGDRFRFIDDPSGPTVYIYRVRAVSVGGISDYLTDSVGVP